MNNFILFMRGYGANGYFPSEASTLPIQTTDSRSQGPGFNVNSKDDIQAVEAHMGTLSTFLIMIMADQRGAANPRLSQEEERHLESLATSLRGALQALLEKRDRLVQEQANG
jgi:hypothetical protein